MSYIPLLIAGSRSNHPRLNLEFTANAFPSSITFTRASTATYYNSAGVLTTAAINEPRIDYDPATLAALGLLIEEQRTNLLTYSAQFDNAAWGKTSCTVTANAAVAPDGTTTMDKLVVDNAISSTAAYVNQALAKAAAATTYTLNFYAKAAEQGGLRLYVRDTATSANFAIVTYNISTGAVITAAAVGGTFTAAGGTITAVGDGIYRGTLIFTTGTETSISIRPSAVTSAGAAFTGNGTDGIYVWGAQLEAGAFATSYIPTVASQVTRSADVAIISGTNFSSWYNQSEGTFVVEYQGTSTAGTVYAASDGSNTNRVTLAFSSASGGCTALTVTTAGATQASIVNPLTVTAVNKSASSYKANDFASAANGGAAVTDTAGTVPTVDRLTIGVRGDGTATFLNGWVKRITYYNTRLPDSTIQGLSAL